MTYRGLPRRLAEKHTTPRETTMNKRLVGGTAAATTATAFAALLARVLPDIRRYFRMRRM
ncbi:hypothetical protein DN051_05420 [Streptomyces cadmiisoli]|uniref:Uncharacterized protein n=1 Tax=Streptomyces cadmiisoli TaxID=2184053 RepID=A0A2Z4IVF5_9ACTN|nr:hypothetical protein DN051_05420 [Streptomyces cadmiisoli]